MATTPATAPSPIPDFDPSDPFRYGWRYVHRAGPAGEMVHERAPLTLEDVLHPQEGDFIVQNEPHQRWCTYLYNVFRFLLARATDAIVLSDCRILWDLTPPLAHGPDLAVIPGVRQRKEWSTFDVAVEGTRPALIVEITSPETAHLDRADKLDEYELAGVPLYIIVDRHRYRGRWQIRLLGYTLTPEGYRPLAPDAQGRLWLDPVGCWLGVAGGEPVCYDADGRPIPDTPALAAALREAEARVEAESAARREAEARVRELEAELRRLRGA